MTLRVPFFASLLGASLSLTSVTVQAQSSFQELRPETRTAARSAMDQVEEYYYKPVSNAMLTDACVQGAAQARANPDGVRSDDDESDVCIRNMLSKLDGPVRYYNVYEALELRQRKPDRAAPLGSVMLAGGVVHIRIPAIDESTPQQLADALAAVSPTKETRLILDLRGNNDDHYMASAALASAFLPRKTLIATASLIKTLEREHIRVGRDYHYGDRSGKLPAALPGLALSAGLVLLVDQQTGGMAELLAAALQDHRRALIVGRTTLGNGRFRTMRSAMYGGFFLLTSGEFVRPSGGMMYGKGVTPDRIVTADKDIDTALAHFRQ